jgi:hypothetical protein
MQSTRTREEEAYFVRTLTDEGKGKRGRRTFFNSRLEG